MYGIGRVLRHRCSTFKYALILKYCIQFSPKHFREQLCPGGYICSVVHPSAMQSYEQHLIPS